MNELMQSYREVIHNYGLFLQNNTGVIRMNGDDCKELLQRLSTNNILSLQQNDSCTTILTNDKGRIIDVITVFSNSSSLLLQTSENNAENVLRWLEKFIIMEDVHVANVSEQYFSFYVSGTNSSNFIESFFFEIPANERMICEIISHTEISIYRCLLPISYFQNETLSFNNETLFEIVRIENGIPLFGKEITIEYNPLEVGLKNYISFSKGCYIGQEVIARLDTYNKVQKQLCGYLFGNYNPEYSDKKIYFENEEIGFVTSSVFSLKRNEWLALGYRDKKINTDSSTYSFLQNGEKIEVKISSLPF